MFRDFVSVGRVRFGVGSVDTLGALTAQLGHSAFLITGGRSLRSSGMFDHIAALLKDAGVEVVVADAVTREPTAQDAEALVSACRAAGCNVIVSVGGGSVMDAGKAVAAIAPNDGDVVDYLEGVGRNLELTAHPLPHIAVPTTAGTGSETTRNGVIGVVEQGVKRSVRHERLLPNVALVDPQLTLDCPPRQTAYSGLDALSQLIEGYVSRNASPFTDALALEGIRRVGDSLARAVEHGDDVEARADMAFAAAASGLVLGNAGLGLVHALAGPLGGMLGAPHGCLCGMLLAPVMRFNSQASIAKHARVGRLLTGREMHEDHVAAEAACEWVEEAARRFGLPVSLVEFGVEPEMIDDIIMRCNPGPLQTNPREASHDQLAGILHILGIEAGGR